MLAKALAKYFGARLLIVESLLLPDVSFSFVTICSWMFVVYCVNQKLACVYGKIENRVQYKFGRRYYIFFTMIDHLQGVSSKDSDSLKYAKKKEKWGILTKQRPGQVDSLLRKRGISDVDPDVESTSITSSRTAKRDTGKAASKIHTFKTGVFLFFLFPIINCFFTHKTKKYLRVNSSCLFYC